MSQNTPNEGEKRIADGPTVHQKIRQKSISEDVEPYNGMRVLTFQNKKQHIVHCGKCLGRCSGINDFYKLENHFIISYILKPSDSTQSTVGS